MDWPPEMPTIDKRYLLSLLNEDLYSIEYDQYENLIEDVIDRPRVFLAGVGRSGLIAKMFAMRLMHCGIDCYMIGDVITPSIRNGDSLIVISGSGETGQLIGFTDKAIQSGAITATITSNPDSTIAKICDYVYPISSDHGHRLLKDVTPMGTRFELSTILFLETIILLYMEMTNTTEKDMKKRHANLE